MPRPLLDPAAQRARAIGAYGDSDVYPVPDGAATTGITLRDYLVGQALAGLCANPNSDKGTTALAREAMDYADAVIELLAGHAFPRLPE